MVKILIQQTNKSRDIVTEIKQEPPDDDDNVDAASLTLSGMLNEDDNAADSVSH